MALEEDQKGESIHLAWIRKIGSVKDCLSYICGRFLYVLLESSLSAIEKKDFMSSLFLVVSCYLDG